MKTIKFIICSCITCFLFAACASNNSQAKKEKEARIAENVKQAIDANSYKIEVNQMIPTGMPSRTVTSTYSLEIRNDSVFSYLPYFGRAYSAPYGGENAMSFAAPLANYEAKYGKKDKTEVEFEVNNNSDKLTFRLTIFPNASTSINVSSVNRQPISYIGEMVLP